jgi:hypothetical protein
MLSTCFRIDARSIVTHDYGATKWAFHDHCTACAKRALDDHCASERALHDGCAALSTHNGRIARASARTSSIKGHNSNNALFLLFRGLVSHRRSRGVLFWQVGAAILVQARNSYLSRLPNIAGVLRVLRFSRTFHRGPDLVNFAKSNRVPLRPPVATLHERP